MNFDHAILAGYLIPIIGFIRMYFISNGWKRRAMDAESELRVLYLRRVGRG